MSDKTMWSRIGSVAIVKVLVMGMTGIIGIFTSRLIIQSFGVPAYGQYGLLATLPTLLPFADLGMAAVIINVVAGSTNPRTDPLVTRTLVTAIRILVGSALVIISAAAILTLMNWWRPILGEGLLPGAEHLPFLCLAIFGLALPLSLGPRCLVGLGQTSTQTAMTAITAPIIFLWVLLLGALGLTRAGNYLALGPYVAAAIVSALGFWVAARRLHPQLAASVCKAPFLQRYPGTKTMHLALPMLVQMVALPIAMQSDRLILSHVTRGPELAEYNLASQLFGIVQQTIAAAGVALWPIFAKARSDGEVVSPMRPTVVFFLAGMIAGAVLAAASPWLVEFVGGGRISLPPLLVFSYVAFVALQAAKYPTGMYMTDAPGLRFQVLPILLMVPINLGVSLLLAREVGAAGPIIASTVCVLLFQLVPNFLYAHRDMRRRAR
jgi:hypothetical protein